MRKGGKKTEGGTRGLFEHVGFFAGMVHTGGKGRGKGKGSL